MSTTPATHDTHDAGGREVDVAKTGARAAVPQLLLEQLHLGELQPAQAREVEARVMADPASAAARATLAESDAAILAAFPPADVLAEARRRAHVLDTRARVAAEPRPRWAALRVALPALAAVALAAVALRPTPPSPTDIEPGLQRPLDEVIRTKGTSAATPTRPVDLLVFRKRADGVEHMANGAQARAGDLVQLGYNARRPAWVAICSVDGRGQVTWHHPDGVDTESPRAKALRVQPGQAVMLDHSYELDDAPAFERFFLVMSDEPFALRPLEIAAHAVTASKDPARAKLALPAGLTQTSFVVKKAPARAHGSTR